LFDRPACCGFLFHNASLVRGLFPGYAVCGTHTDDFLDILFRIFRKIYDFNMPSILVLPENGWTEFEARPTVVTLTRVNDRNLSHKGLILCSLGIFNVTLAESSNAGLSNKRECWNLLQRHSSPFIEVE